MRKQGIAMIAAAAALAMAGGGVPIEPRRGRMKPADPESTGAKLAKSFARVMEKRTPADVLRIQKAEEKRQRKAARRREIGQ